MKYLKLLKNIILMISNDINVHNYKIGDHVMLKDSAVEYYKECKLYKFAKIEKITPYSCRLYAISTRKYKIKLSVDTFIIETYFIKRKMTKNEIKEFELQKNTILYNI